MADAAPGPMSAPPAGEKTGSVEAVVIAVDFEVAHDSDGLISVVLRHPNGATGRMQLEGEALGRIVSELGLATIQDLVGLPFSQIAPSLPANSRD